jgi:hypothetical protein
MNLWRRHGQLYLHIHCSVERCECGNKPFLARAYCKSWGKPAVARKLLHISARTAVDWTARRKVMTVHSLWWVNKTV